jgi:tryptophan synthase alpha subunit
MQARFVEQARQENETADGIVTGTRVSERVHRRHPERAPLSRHKDAVNSFCVME